MCRPLCALPLPRGHAISSPSKENAATRSQCFCPRKLIKAEVCAAFGAGHRDTLYPACAEVPGPQEESKRTA